MQVVRCHECDRAIDAAARYCSHCGTAVQLVPLTEHLKIVTVLYCDIVDSTALSAQLGPSGFNELGRRYMNIVRNAVERQGGSCGKRTGDGVMAVFGVPTLKADDALRAARAAVQITKDVASLSEDYHRRHSLLIETRMGINTGQALVRNLGPVEEQVAGLTVNIAKRLESQAPSNQILIGHETYRLIQEGVTAEPVYPPLELKGIQDPVPAWRLTDMSDGRSIIRDGPLIGRSRDLALLLHLLERVRDDQSFHLVTLTGLPGIGKSRLVREFERQARDTRVLKSACLPYGEGVAFWPIAEIVRQAAGVRPADSPRVALDRLSKLTFREPDGRRITRRIGHLLGWLTEPVTAADADLLEFNWALSRLIEVLAREKPLALIVDDLQWADAGLLDTIKEIAEATEGSRVILITMTRPELWDKYEDWASGIGNTAHLQLPPLKEQDSGRLVTHLLEERQMGGEKELLDYIHKHAEGNPLFVEAYLSMLRERETLTLDEHGEWTLQENLEVVGEEVPPQLRVVIAARLDTLESLQRRILERAAVVGGRFHAENILALSPGEPVDEVLNTLERLEHQALIIPEPMAAAQFPARYGQQGYRFRHMLYRDVAYESLPETEVASLHERYATWAEDATAEEPQHDEIVASHLLRAYQVRRRNDPDSDSTRVLGRRAGERLLRAGQHASGRGELAAALQLLERVPELLPTDHPQRPNATLDLADVLRESNVPKAVDLYRSVIELAAATGDEGARMHAELGALELVGSFSAPEKPLDEGGELSQRAVEVFERVGDDVGLVKAWRLRAFIDFAAGANGKALEAIARAQEYARRAGDDRFESFIRDLGSVILFWGKNPLSQVVPELEATLDWAKAKNARGLEATVLGLLARAAAMQGDFPRARRLNEEASEIRYSTGEQLTAAADSLSKGLVELLAGEPEEAERILRQGYDDLTLMGGKTAQVNVGVLLARAMLRQSRYVEAEALTREIEKAVPVSQLDARIKWRSIRAVILATRAEAAEADRLITQALALAAKTEQVNSVAETKLDHAEVLLLLRRHEAAAQAAREAQAEYLRKGNLMAAEEAKQLAERSREGDTPAVRAVG